MCLRNCLFLKVATLYLHDNVSKVNGSTTETTPVPIITMRWDNSYTCVASDHSRRDHSRAV